MSRNNILSRSSQHRAVPTTSRSKRRLDGAQRPVVASPPAAAMALSEDGARQPGTRGPEPGLQVSTRRYALTPVARAADKRRSAAEPLPQDGPCATLTSLPLRRVWGPEWSPLWAGRGRGAVIGAEPRAAAQAVSWAEGRPPEGSTRRCCYWVPPLLLREVGLTRTPVPCQKVRSQVQATQLAFQLLYYQMERREKWVRSEES